MRVDIFNKRYAFSFTCIFTRSGIDSTKFSHISASSSSWYETLITSYLSWYQTLITALTIFCIFIVHYKYLYNKEDCYYKKDNGNYNGKLDA